MSLTTTVLRIILMWMPDRPSWSSWMGMRLAIDMEFAQCQQVDSEEQELPC